MIQATLWTLSTLPHFPQLCLASPSPIPGLPEQLAFFCISIIRKEEKRSYDGTKEKH
jgi:hypothetical protein